mgnify:FL=1
MSLFGSKSKLAEFAGLAALSLPFGAALPACSQTEELTVTPEEVAADPSHYEGKFLRIQGYASIDYNLTELDYGTALRSYTTMRVKSDSTSPGVELLMHEFDRTPQQAKPQWKEEDWRTKLQPPQGVVEVSGELYVHRDGHLALMGQRVKPIE